MGVPEGKDRDQEIEKLFEKTMAENFPNLIKERNTINTRNTSNTK